MTSLSKRIIVIGGSFGGLSTVKSLVTLFTKNKPTNVNVELFLLEPRAGFINVLAIPQAIIDVPFAKTSYAPLKDFNLKFDTVESKNPEVIESVKNNKITIEESPSNLKLHYIQGKCIEFIDNNTISYKLNGDDPIKNLKFDYAVFSTGRSRNWPFDPKGETKTGFLEEVQSFKEKVDKSQRISVIGGGALGIEVAGSLKQLYKDKDITLIHPHPSLPPEKFITDKFREAIANGIKEQGIKLELNTRIKEELPNGNLITVTGDTIKSDLSLWCNSHKNNIEPLLPLFEDSIDPIKQEVIVEENFLIKNQKNIFAIGDIINLPIFRVAGAAYYCGNYVANSLYNLIVEGKEEYVSIDLKTWPKGFVIVIGTEYCIFQTETGVSINEPGYLALYKDYRNKNLLEDSFEFLPQA